MGRYTLPLSFVLCATSIVSAGLDLEVSAPTVANGYTVYELSSVWDGADVPLQTVEYTFVSTHQEWYHLTPTVALTTISPGDAGFGLVDTTIDSHILLPVVANASDFLFITAPYETMAGEMGSILGYKGYTPQQTITPLFQISVSPGTAVQYFVKLTSATGTKHAFKGELPAIPEPASMCLIGLGAVALIRRSGKQPDFSTPNPPRWRVPHPKELSK